MVRIEELSDVSIADVGVEAIIADALKAFREDMLDHATDEAQDGQSGVLDLSGFMVPIPVTDSLAVVAFDAVDGDRRGDDIFGEIASEAAALGGQIAFFDEGDEAFWVVFPGAIKGGFDSGVGDVLTEQGEEMVLPFAMDDVEREVGDVFPGLMLGEAAGGEEDMEMGVVISGAAGGLQDDDGAGVERLACDGVEDIQQAGLAGLNEKGQ